MTNKKLRPVNCDGCNLCCWYETVPLQRNEVDRFQHEEDTDEHGNKRFILAHDAEMKCVYLGPKGCTIWHDKPQACNAYDCLLWVEHFGIEKCRQRMHKQLFARAMMRYTNKQAETKQKASKPKMWRKNRVRKVKR